MTRTLSLGFTVLALLLTGCSGGPGTELEFVEILQNNDTFSESQATCIASAVFDEYEADPDALDKLSGADTWEDITGAEGVAGFESFYTDVVSDCVAVGPTPDS